MRDISKCWKCMIGAAIVSVIAMAIVWRHRALRCSIYGNDSCVAASVGPIIGMKGGE